MPKSPNQWACARRCMLCDIDFPDLNQFQECPACGEPLSRYSGMMPHEDWKQRAYDRSIELDGDIPDYGPTTP